MLSYFYIFTECSAMFVAPPPLTMGVDMFQTTAPEPADNRWFCYSSVAEVLQLRAALAAKGERESVLRDALIANDPLIRSGLTAKP